MGTVVWPLLWAALELQTGLAELHTQPPPQMRVGIHTGLVVLGQIGSEVKLEYTAIGDAMNYLNRKLIARAEKISQLEWGDCICSMPPSIAL